MPGESQASQLFLNQWRTMPKTAAWFRTSRTSGHSSLLGSCLVANFISPFNGHIVHFYVRFRSEVTVPCDTRALKYNVHIEDLEGKTQSAQFFLIPLNGLSDE